ncbi:hypothetical protein [Ekhidna sp.]|jgi:hypothetical protein|uniref:hypothetical protein n=1 Tax=Ekhidna sp. TaxID=2608089 RepID=UPI0032EBF363
MASSKQINYYAFFDEINDFLSQQEELCIIGLPIYNKEIKTVASLGSADFGWGLQYRLTNREFFDQVNLKFIEEQNYYLVDSLRSPVIDLSLCFFDKEEKYLRRGRIYLQKEYYDDGVLKSKDSGFLAWADSFFKQFSQEICSRKDESNDFISNQVAKIVDVDSIKLVSN